MLTALSPGFLSHAKDPQPSKLKSWLRNDLDQLVSLVENLNGASDRSSVRAEIATAAHNLKGLSTTYGFPILARLCRRLQSLAEAPDSGAHNDALIELHALACLACVRDGATGERDEPLLSALLVGLENALLAYDLKR